MNTAELTIELIADLIAMLLGILLIVKRTDNQQRLFWGMISVSIGFIFSWENIYWIFKVHVQSDYEYNDILNIEKMLKWFAAATIISLFPLASLRPGYINLKRFIVYLLPFICILLIALCFLQSNSAHNFRSVREILSHINLFEVKLRILIFLLSITIPFIYFNYPLFAAKGTRKANITMYVFIMFNYFLLFIYIGFTLFINSFFFNAMGIVSVLFSILFSVLYLKSENPMSFYVNTPDKTTIKNTQKCNQKYNQTFITINNYIKSNKLFVQSNFQIEMLTAPLGFTLTDINVSIKNEGYSSFREYINITRLEYFKELVAENPNRTIKELMFNCGFNSRTTFYRTFAEHYEITPNQYIEKQIITHNQNIQ